MKHQRRIAFHRLLGLLFWGLALTLLPAAGLAADAEISLTCDQEPKQAGLELDRAGVAYESINVEGQATDAWVARQGSVPEDPWARSFRLKVTAPAFREGRMPVVDIEVTYLHQANTKVEVLGDTSRGSVVVGGGWGNQRKWQTLRIRLDDAYFGQRQHGNEARKLPVDGYDLRINAWGGDIYLRSVVVRGLDRTQVKDWARFLAVEKVDSKQGHISAPGAKDELTFHLRNRALVPVTGKAQWETIDAAGKVLASSRQDLQLPADAPTAIPYTFDGQKLPAGCYGVRLRAQIQQGPTQIPVLNYEQTHVVAGPEDLFIVFDKEPIARGMTFDRTNVAPLQIDVGGAKQWLWQATHGSQRGGDGWWRSFCFTITDPRFRNGGRPAVDITVVYRHEANAPVQLFADTNAGSRQIGFGWGRNPNWQVMSCQIDDARFNQTDYHSNPKDLKTDGFDLRYNANTSDAQLRAIFIHGYERDKNPDYRRLLRFDGLDAGRELFIFEPSSKGQFTLKLRNLANLPLDARYTVTLRDDLGRVQWERTQTTTIAAQGPFGVPVDFDTAGLKQGVYTLALSLGRVVDDKYEALVQPSVNLMVAERSPIRKAKPGEFLYGLDTGVSYQDERFLQWADFMGADITRGCGPNQNPDDWGNAFAALGKFGLQASVFMDIPWDSDPGRLKEKVEKTAARAKAAAEKYAAQAYYWELGNEPDLTFFYPGPIESYVQGYVAVAQAIKQGNPQACVMNGGLCFAGAEGDQRARKFIELVPGDSLDAWAFHGHGPGAAAERHAYQRILAEARKWGKADKPFIETESGFAARTPGQLRVQARTAIQKMVFAQSVGIPVFMWFRLYITGGDGDYTNLLNVHEPRPVVLSYRTMVKTLRDMKYHSRIDLESPELEAYGFAQPDGPARAMVFWANTGGGSTRTLALAGANDVVQDMQLIDMFGNVTSLPQTTGGVVTVPVEMDPAFLVWRTTGKDLTARVLPSPLTVDPLVLLTPGTREQIPVRITNYAHQPLAAALTIQAGAQSGAVPAQGSIPVTAAAQTTVEVPVEVDVKPVTQTLAWPARWTVFTNVPASGVDPAAWRQIPEQLEVAGKVIRPKIVRLREERIDLAALAGGYREKAQALVAAELTVAQACTIRIGASADWWMEWIINGQRVYDTLATGNQSGYSILDHQFEAPLVAGRNLIVVRVLSGSQGWKLYCGGPEQIAAAKGEPGSSRTLKLELRVGESLLARQRIPVVLRQRVPRLDKPGWDDPATAWSEVEPQGDIADEYLINEFAKQPDSSRWWKGDADLSGHVWLRSDPDHLYVIAAIRDDVFKPAVGAAGIDLGDSLRLALAGKDGSVLQLGIPGGKDGIYIRRPDAQGQLVWQTLPGDAADARVDRVDRPEGGVTWYRLKLARRLLPSNQLTLNVLANDNDAGMHKQSAAWFAGMDDPAAVLRWYPLTLD